MLITFISMLDTDEDKDKLTKIYEKYYGTMLSVAKSILFDTALAEDSVSESIIAILKNLDKITDVSSHKTRAYIVIIVRNCSINLLNKQKRYREEVADVFDLPDSKNPPILDELTIKESCNRITYLIKTLSKPLSDVLYLSVVMGHSHKETSELLNISTDAARQRLSRAKALLREMLAQEVINYGSK